MIPFPLAIFPFPFYNISFKKHRLGAILRYVFLLLFFFHLRVIIFARNQPTPLCLFDVTTSKHML